MILFEKGKGYERENGYPECRLRNGKRGFTLVELLRCAVFNRFALRYDRFLFRSCGQAIEKLCKANIPSWSNARCSVPM